MRPLSPQQQAAWDKLRPVIERDEELRSFFTTPAVGTTFFLQQLEAFYKGEDLYGSVTPRRPTLVGQPLRASRRHQNQGHAGREVRREGRHAEDALLPPAPPAPVVLSGEEGF